MYSKFGFDIFGSHITPMMTMREIPSIWFNNISFKISPETLSWRRRIQQFN